VSYIEAYIRIVKMQCNALAVKTANVFVSEHNVERVLKTSNSATKSTYFRAFSVKLDYFRQSGSTFNMGATVRSAHT
jgi:hypothetical protein